MTLSAVCCCKSIVTSIQCIDETYREDESILCYFSLVSVLGLGDPTALTQAVSAYQACNLIGMPECDVSVC